jgi:hypothetical protein
MKYKYTVDNFINDMIILALAIFVSICMTKIFITNKQAVDTNTLIDQQYPSIEITPEYDRGSVKIRDDIRLEEHIIDESK